MGYTVLSFEAETIIIERVEKNPFCPPGGNRRSRSRERKKAKPGSGANNIPLGASTSANGIMKQMPDSSSFKDRLEALLKVRPRSGEVIFLKRGSR